MRLSVKKETGAYVVRIWLKQVLVFEQYEYKSREEATLDAWVNALLIRDIAVATEQSVEALINGYV